MISNKFRKTLKSERKTQRAKAPDRRVKPHRTQELRHFFACYFIVASLITVLELVRCPRQLLCTGMGRQATGIPMGTASAPGVGFRLRVRVRLSVRVRVTVRLSVRVMARVGPVKAAALRLRSHSSLGGKVGRLAFLMVAAMSSSVA